MNEIVTPKWLTREIVEQFDRDLKALSAMERIAVDVCPVTKYRLGQPGSIRPPQRFVVREGQQMDPQPIAEPVRVERITPNPEGEEWTVSDWEAVKWESDEDEQAYVAKPAPAPVQRLDVLYGVGVLEAGLKPQTPKPERKRAEILRPVLRTFSADVED